MSLNRAARKSRKKKRSIEEINAEMKKIFAKHSIIPELGDEGFWNAVEDVGDLSSEDADLLTDLSAEWEVASALQREER